MELNENFLSNVAGRKSVKDELRLIFNWFKNRKNFENENVIVPKGILFCGSPGTGKTYVMKEFAKMFDLPIIEIDGSSMIANQSIDHAFDEARNLGEAIIFIDELGLLIDKDRHAIRSLQVNMDGYKERGDIIVLATTNSLPNIPEPLLRRGRFDRIISFDHPSKEDIEPLFRFYINKIGAKSYVDYDYIKNYVVSLSCSDIVAIVNDAYLRSDGGSITTETLEKSYNAIVLEEYNDTIIEDENQRNYCAVHEASHCVMMYKYDDYHKLYRASIMKNADKGGHVMSTFNGFENEPILLAQIDICIAGAIGTRVIFKEADAGCFRDINVAHRTLSVLVDKFGYIGIEKTLPHYSPNSRHETFIVRHRNEKMIGKILKKRVRIVTKYLKKNKDKILKIAEALKEKGVLTRKELLGILETN